MSSKTIEVDKAALEILLQQNKEMKAELLLVCSASKKIIETIKPFISEENIGKKGFLGGSQMGAVMSLMTDSNFKKSAQEALSSFTPEYLAIVQKHAKHE